MQRIKCDFCEVVARPDNIREHIKIKHQKIKEVCLDCGNTFATKSSLKRHQSNQINQACKKKQSKETKGIADANGPVPIAEPKCAEDIELLNEEDIATNEGLQHITFAVFLNDFQNTLFCYRF